MRKINRKKNKAQRDFCLLLSCCLVVNKKGREREATGSGQRSTSLLFFSRKANDSFSSHMKNKKSRVPKSNFENFFQLGVKFEGF